MLLICGVATGLAYAWWHFDFAQMSDDERNAYDDGLKKFADKWWFPPASRRATTRFWRCSSIDDAGCSRPSPSSPWRERYGSWPYDRVIWSDVLDYLSEAGARIVVMDVTLSEPKSDVTGDLALGESIAAASMPTIMGFNALQHMPVLPKVEVPLNRIHVATPPKPPPEPAVSDGGDTGEFPDDTTFPDEKDTAAVETAHQAMVSARRNGAAIAYAFPVKLEGGLASGSVSPGAGPHACSTLARRAPTTFASSGHGDRRPAPLSRAGHRGGVGARRRLWHRRARGRRRRQDAKRSVRVLRRLERLCDALRRRSSRPLAREGHHARAGLSTHRRPHHSHQPRWEVPASTTPAS